MTRTARARRPASPPAASAGARKASRPAPSVTSRSAKATSGCASARRRTISATACASARSERRNLSRAGVAWKRSRSSTVVPQARASGLGPESLPPSQAIPAPSAPSTRETIRSRPAAPIDASASPRKPKLRMAMRSAPSVLEVAWRASARGSACASIPQPSSSTRIRVRPPWAIATSTRDAPASSAFSTSSFTAEAGRSITSPAAMRLTAASPRSRIGARPGGRGRSSMTTG